MYYIDLVKVSNEKYIGLQMGEIMTMVSHKTSGVLHEEEIEDPNGTKDMKKITINFKERVKVLLEGIGLDKEEVDGILEETVAGDDSFVLQVTSPFDHYESPPFMILSYVLNEKDLELWIVESDVNTERNIDNLFF